MNRNRSWLAFAVLTACALLMVVGVPKLRALSDEKACQRFVGTWVNTEYAGTPEQAQVQVNKQDYEMEEWLTPDSASPSNQWKAVVRKTWVDKEGNTYCQYVAASAGHPGWLSAWLMRVDKARKVLEFQYGGATNSESKLRFPEAIDPDKPSDYWIYYRTK